MPRITFRYQPVINKTVIRVNKNYYPYRFICYLKEKSDFNFVTSNRINHVFSYVGNQDKAEFYLVTHLIVYNNLQNKINQNN